MLEQIKTVFMTLLVVSSLSMAYATKGHAQAFPDNELTAVEYKDLTISQTRQPGTIAMGADILIARPLLFAATVLGTGLFVVSLPLSVLGNNVDKASQKLVVVPAKATFFRCLGCSMSDNG